MLKKKETKQGKLFEISKLWKPQSGEKKTNDLENKCLDQQASIKELLQKLQDKRYKLQERESIDQQLKKLFETLTCVSHDISFFKEGEVFSIRKDFNEQKVKGKELEKKIIQLESKNQSLVEDKQKIEAISQIHENTIDSLKTILEGKANVSEELNTQIEKNTQLLEEIHELKKGLDEHDRQLKRAEEYIAKKIKEANHIEEQFKQMHADKVVKKEEVQHLQAEIHTLVHNLELQSNHKQELRALAQEKTRPALNQGKEWQVRFFNVQEQLQKNISCMVTLEQKFNCLEEEYRELCLFLSQIKKMLGKKISLSDFPEIASKIEKTPLKKSPPSRKSYFSNTTNDTEAQLDFFERLHAISSTKNSDLFMN